MRLKAIGHICPECGGECREDLRKRWRYPGWMGFCYWSACYSCHIGYLILFDDKERFVTIVPNDGVTIDSGTLTQAGTIEPEPGDIPF